MIKQYPNPNDEEGKYSAKEINRGDHILRQDIECSCGYVVAVSNLRTDQCPRCGRKLR
jgi:hypothetical protein